MFLTAQPHPALKPFVRAYWYLQLTHNEQLLELPITPAPENCLYFYPKDKLKANFQDQSKSKSDFPDNIITGQFTSRHNLLIPNNYLMFKVLLQPAGFFRLFGVPMTLFTNSHEEANLVLGSEMTQVNQQIQNAETFERMVEIIEGYLLKKITSYKVDRHPIDEVLKQPNFYRFSLDRLAYDACLSSRQFERKFLERTGVSPKFYSRIARFNQAMKRKVDFPGQSWLHVAYDCGYFDHNHLLRDFKQFTNEVPTDFDFKNAIIY